ncbi:MAG: DUF1631 family protein [Proteobacteria bacterium]|nr:DUF1631 family protein [Pseudomonadota bacterium]
MPIAPLLQRFVDDELTRSAALAEKTVNGTLEALTSGKGGFTAAERGQLGPLIEALRRHARSYVGAFVESLRAEVLDGLRELTNDQAHAAPAAAGPGGLELMDESRVEVDIEISRAMRTIDNAAEWELRELQTYTSTLIGQTHVSAESNPFRPIMVARALWQAASAVTPAHAQRAALLRISSEVIAGLLKGAWAAACTRLEQQGVEPSVYRTVLLAPGAVPGRSRNEAGTTRAGTLGSLLGGLPPLPANAPVADTAEHGAHFEAALARLDELLRQLPGQPGTDREAAAALLRSLGDQRKAVAASVGGVDHQIVELVTRLFETVLSDSDLQPAFRPALARLQVSVLRVGLRDAALLDGGQHPAWQLVDRIGEASFAYPQPGDPRAAALQSVCEVLAEDLARTPTPDAGTFRRSLARLDIFLTEQLHQAIQAAQGTADAMARTERRELLEQQLGQRLSGELRGVAASPLVRSFVTGAWAQVLAEAMLRHGEDSDLTRAYLRTTEDLIWSLAPPDHAQSRQRLVALLPALLQRLHAGMAMIDLPAAEQRAVLDALMHIHTDALRPGARAVPAPQPSTEEVMRRLQAEAGPAHEPSAFADSLIDVPSMETVPAELMTAASAAPGHPLVDAMSAGRRYRLFLQGRWRRTQLLWRSPQGRLLLFAGEDPQRTHSVTRRALERLEEAQLIKPLAEPGLVQRSIDSLRRQLAAV